MGKMEATLRDEIARLARKEIRSALGPMNKQVKEMRKALRELSRTARELRRGPAPTQKSITLEVSKEELAAARITARWIKNLRKKLNLSQGQLAQLLGVSLSAIGAWEYGRAKPGGSNQAALIALRKLGRRQIKQALKQSADKSEAPKKKAAKKKAAKKKTAKK